MSRLSMVQGTGLDDLLSGAPGALDADNEMRGQIRQQLSPRLYALIGVVVAGCLGCEQFVENLRGPLDGFAAVQIAKDWRNAALAEAERAALAYAEKGTLEEGSVRRADVEALRTAGFDDKDILVIATAIAYHNYSIRMAAVFAVTPR
ncbi:MAG: hypothetical protein OEN50_13875 [Deltaproteobacteria bacterium]|nr:hypothetical protein [Deltaproteobacteria bacterium]